MSMLMLSVGLVSADKPAHAGTCTLADGSSSATGFDEFGYNNCAHQFVGTCHSWYLGKFGGSDAQATAYCGVYDNDKLVMKWNEEWDRGNAEGWANPPYDAWENNQWNGKCDGCSGEIWHYKIAWVSDPENNQYPIWGQFAVLMSQGTTPDDGHIWETHEIPTGYGFY